MTSLLRTIVQDGYVQMLAVLAAPVDPAATQAALAPHFLDPERAGGSPAGAMLAVAALRARDVLPVFAVGDDGPATSSAPSNRAGALAVGASDGRDELARSSGSQRFADRTVPDVVAPDISLKSCAPGGG